MCERQCLLQSVVRGEGKLSTERMRGRCLRKLGPAPNIGWLLKGGKKKKKQFPDKDQSSFSPSDFADTMCNTYDKWVVESNLPYIFCTEVVFIIVGGRKGERRFFF